MLFRYLLPLMLLAMFTARAQQAIEPDAGGTAKYEVGECITPQHHADLKHMLAENTRMLQAKGILPNNSPRKTTATSFIWPMQQNAGPLHNNIFYIYHFVDLLQSNNYIWDYDCGTRTYNQHPGTDIFPWPFIWNAMDNEWVKIVAAADGVITVKNDGTSDRYCGLPIRPNAVCLTHDDGTVSWYSHLKNGSLTSKPIGARVTAGEYLAIVGSSGTSSTHLHFEVYDATGSLLDPFVGYCGSGPRLWQSQMPYYRPNINILLTHSRIPQLSLCPNPDILYIKDTFDRRDSVFFGVYLQDRLDTLRDTFTVYRPDGSVFDTWSSPVPTARFAENYWGVWGKLLPNDAPYGKWTFKGKYGGVQVSHDFYVHKSVGIDDAATNNGISFYPNPGDAHFTLLSGMPYGNYTLTITNIAGQMLHTETYKHTGRQKEFDLRHLHPGLYLLHLRGDGASESIKFTITR
jgi:hypothetical protein